MDGELKVIKKRELLERLEKYEDDDYIGVLTSAQDGRKKPSHEVFIFYDAEKII